MSATYFFLTIENGRVVIKYAGTSGGEHTRVIRSYKDYCDLLTSKAAEAGVPLEALRIAASSSLDFPQEYTQDPAVLALVRELTA